MPIDKMGLVVNASFPQDTATPVHILNSGNVDSEEMYDDDAVVTITEKQ